MSDIVERLRTAFTADQMRAYAAACVAAEREQWREIVEQLIARHDYPMCPAIAVMANNWSNT